MPRPGLVLRLAVAVPPRRVDHVDAAGPPPLRLGHTQAVLVADLRLANVSIYSGRIEDFEKLGIFDAVTARAFSSLPLLVKVGAPLLRSGARIYAMKGVLPREEIADLPSGWRVATSHRLRVPGLDAERHLLILERN